MESALSKFKNTHEHHVRFSFCPVCAAPLDDGDPKHAGSALLPCSSCGFTPLLDPKVVACTLIEKGGRIVLAKRAIHPEKGKWVMPGGYVDRGEEVQHAAIRETIEECGITVKIGNLLGVYSYAGYPVVVIVYEGTHVSGSLGAGSEVSEVRLFSHEEIPWERLAFPSTTEALKDYFRNKQGALKK